MPEGRTKLDRGIARTEKIFLLIDPKTPEELLSHYARYLCIVVAGFAEASTKDLISEHIHDHTKTAPQTHRLVVSYLADLWGLNYEKFKKLVTTMDPAWWTLLYDTKHQELGSLGSLSTLRNKIAHGDDVGTTFLEMRQYFANISDLMITFSDLLDA